MVSADTSAQPRDPVALDWREKKTSLRAAGGVPRRGSYPSRP
jgi:hypothetical protein